MIDDWNNILLKIEQWIWIRWLDLNGKLKNILTQSIWNTVKKCLWLLKENEMNKRVDLK